jgi:hypothetical protein
LADEVLDELRRRDLISLTQRDYYAGSCTRAEAKAAHLADDPVRRAADIVRLFTSEDERFLDAIRVAVTSQSTRKRMTSKLMNELATALILRAVSNDPGKVDQIRRYLRHAFSKSTHREHWKATGRTTDQLVEAAQREVREAISSGRTGEPGPDSLELAVRASYPLVVSGRLSADRGSSGNDQPDRRTPGEVLDAMRRSSHGIHQLGQALRDFEAGVAIRAVDEAGLPRQLTDGSAALTISDVLLRKVFPPPGRAKASRPGDTPSDRYDAAIEGLANAFHELDRGFEALTRVRGDDDQPIVDSRGVELRLTDAWRDLLRRVDEEVVVWARTYRKTYFVVPTPGEFTSDQVEDGEDPYSEVDYEEVDEG